MICRLLFAIFLAAVWPLQAALVTSHTDSVAGSPSVDGTISPNEYGTANAYSYTGGGAGFGGQLGSATLHMKSDVQYLYLGFSNLGVPGDANQYLVYFHTRSGGFHPNGTEMDDTSDGGRANVSRLSADGPEFISFYEGSTNRADFALLFNNRGSPEGFSALFDLKAAGNAHALVAHSAAGLGTAQVEFRVLLSDLGVPNAGAVDFVSMEISGTGFLSNEGLPDPQLGANPGFDGGTLIYSNFHRFVTRSLGIHTGIMVRKENTTLNMPLVAPVTNSFATETAFPSVTFTNPMAIANAPGESNRLYILERPGLIVVITNLASPTRTVFLNHSASVNVDGEGGFLGFAFHPGYLTNRQFFVYYTRNANNGTGNGFHTRLSRFERTTTNENLALSSSELVLFSQFNNANNHNGGDVHFGPDGYLYLSVGDEGGFNDNLNNSQIIDKDFFAGLLRLDVDKKPGSFAPNHHAALGGVTNYSIPPDNPLIGVTNFYGSNVVPARVRTEFYATGLRNPFRFSFDPVGGALYCADVGQDAWEEINLVTNGGNYGWAAREGFVAGPKYFGFPASAYANPILSYGHGFATDQGYSISGGIVYRGDQLPELVGHYLFADYVSGNLWSLTHNGITNTSFNWLLNDDNIVAFGADPSNGDVLLCDLVGQVKRLVYAAGSTNMLPVNLSGTGIFADLGSLSTFEGIVPYEINVPFWSDGATKYRWFSLPSTNLEFDFSATGRWTFPTTTVWVKHFDMQMTSGVPSSVRRLETRVLVKNDSVDGGYGVTYRWGNSTSDAVLVPPQGLDEQLLVNVAGNVRTQVWRYPSRSECLTCHSPGAGFALGFNTPQLNKVHDFGDVVTNEIAALENAGYFSGSVENEHLLRKVAQSDDDEFSTAYRVRSYLQVNCGQCHFPGGPTPAGFDTRLTTPMSRANIIDGALNDNGGNPANRVIVRNVQTNSMILNRISKRGTGQMPPLGSNLLDTQNIALVQAWITGEAAGYETFSEWQIRHFGSTNSPFAQRNVDFDGDGVLNEAEFLTGTQPTNDLAAWGLDALSMSGGVSSVNFEKAGGAGFEVQVSTNLMPGSWHPLNVPENAPVFSPGAASANVPDLAHTNHPARFYRVNIFEP